MVMPNKMPLPAVEAGVVPDAGEKPRIVAAPAAVSPELSPRPKPVSSAAWSGPRRSSTFRKILRPSGDCLAPRRQRRDAAMSAIAALASDRGLGSAACAAVGVARASVHRHRTRPPRALGSPRTPDGARPSARAALLKALFEETLAKHVVPPGQLTLLAGLGVTKSHSRPHTSNDTPFSEAHFRMPGPSAAISSPGTTATTIMPGSA